jgi:putative DNA primase/helicase
MADTIAEFSEAIRRSGLAPPDEVVADGRIHRFRSGPERAPNGFYRLVVVPSYRGGEIGFGMFGCWKRGVHERWCSRERGEISAPDWAGIERVRAARRQAEADAAREAAQLAAAIWDKARAPDPGHPYLRAKGIGAGGIRQHKGLLVVPVCRDGVLSSLQFIAPDGGKRFLSGGQVEGGYARIPGAGRRIIIAEGYATAASLHAVTGDTAIAAFAAGNLLPVARAVRAQHPHAPVVVAGDNDQYTVIGGKPVNVGVERATRAAAEVGARLAIPPFPHEGAERLTDWNDYLVLYGRAAASEAFEAACGGRARLQGRGGAARGR